MGEGSSGASIDSENNNSKDATNEAKLSGAGSGGISRGRGDAAMSWGDESPGQTEKLNTKLLPPASEMDTDHHQMVGLSANAPEVKPQGESAGKVDFDASGGKTSWRRRLAPRHRDAVREYFTNKGK